MANYRNGKILVIDDDQKILDLAEDILSDEGYNFFLAENGEIGLELAREHQPDVILLDIMMPGIDGFEVCRRLKTPGSGLEAIKIIMLTAKDSADDVAKGLNCGAEDYVPKPYKAVELLARVNTQLRIKLAEDALKNSLNEAEHLAEIGRMTSEIVHDLNNVFTLISFQVVETIVDELREVVEVVQASDLLDKLTEFCKVGNEGIQLGTTMTEGLVTFMRGARTWYALQPLATILEIPFKILKRRLNQAGVVTEFNPGHKIPDVKCNSGKIQRVALNLIVNAMHAMESVTEKRLTVQIWSKDQQVCFSVADTGPGIPTDIQPKIFDRHFTTKDKGTGLGLASVKEIVAAHGGKIDFITEIGKGTTFSVSLPIESKNIH